MKNYYEILGVSDSASDEEIKKAFREKTRKFHPDKNQGNKEIEEKYKEILESYEVLSNKEKKQQYDASVKSPRRGSGNRAWDMFFSQFDRSKVGTDIVLKVHVTLEELFNNKEKTIKYDRKFFCDACKGEGSESVKPCPSCGGLGFSIRNFSGVQIRHFCGDCLGKGKIRDKICVKCIGSGFEITKETVTVPLNHTDNQVVLPNYGNLDGDVPGYLVIKFFIDQHKDFHLELDNLIYFLQISALELIVGASKEIPVIEGGLININIPKATQPEEVLRVKGKGMKRKNGQRGDLIIKIKCIIPRLKGKDFEAIKTLLHES